MIDNNLIVEVVKGHDKCEKRTFNDRDVFEQKAYIHNGGAFPQQIKISHDSLAHALSVGKYNISLDSYQPNKYGKLELSPFNTKYISVMD